MTLRRLLFALGAVGALCVSLMSQVATILLLVAVGIVVAHEKLTTERRAPDKRWSTATLVLLYQWLVASGLVAVTALRTSLVGSMTLVLVVVAVAATDASLAIARKSMKAATTTPLELFAVWLIGVIVSGSLFIGYLRFGSGFSWTDGLFVVLTPLMTLLAHWLWSKLKQRLGVASYGRFLGLPYGLMDYVQSYGASLALWMLTAWAWYVVL